MESNSHNCWQSHKHWQIKLHQNEKVVLTKTRQKDAQTSTDWGKHSQNHVFDKAMASIIYKEPKEILIVYKLERTWALNSVIFTFKTSNHVSLLIVNVTLAKLDESLIFQLVLIDSSNIILRRWASFRPSQSKSKF